MALLLSASLTSCAGTDPKDPVEGAPTDGTTTDGTGPDVSSVDPSSTAPVDPTDVAPSQVAPATTPDPSDTSAPTTTPDPSTDPSASTGSEPDADASAPGEDAGPDEPEVVSREWLSETGLYADIATETLAEGVQSFTPRFQLWTDTAEKRRWVYIPEGTQINTSDIDEWKFPVGFKLWKEFTRDGVRVETRLIEKLPPERAREGFEGWLSIAYVWNEDQSDAIATPDGLVDAKGTPHDVPDQKACGQCHDMRVEKPLGFSAVQLSHEGEGATLSTLMADGWLTDAPTADLTVPGDETQQELLGYFHANCGHCHRQSSPVDSRVSGLHLWLESDALGSFEESNTYVSLVSKESVSGQGSIFPMRVVPGDPDNSELMRRLLFRAEGEAPTETPLDGGAGAPPDGEPVEVPMPPLGTEMIDEPAVERVRTWIMSLQP